MRGQTIFLRLVLTAIVISGCINNASTNGGNHAPGTLSFNYNGQLLVSKGSVQQVALFLNNSQGVVAQDIQIISDQPQIASVTPRTCSVSTATPYCVITIQGKTSGDVNINAVAAGYTPISLSSSVTNAPVYGSLGVETSVFPNVYPITMESGGSSNQITLKFSSYTAQHYNGQNDMPSGNYYLAYVTGGLLDSSGIASNNPGYFNVAPLSNIYTTQGYGYHSDGTGRVQCTNEGITSNSPICTLTFLVPESALINNLPITLNAQIAGNQSANYSQMTIIAQPDPTPYPGIIQLGTQTSNIPLNMHAPIFLNWKNVAMSGTITVQVSSSSPNVQFYNYSVTNGVTSENLSQTTSCTLQFPQTQTLGSAGNYGVSCGLGVKGISNGSSIISAQISSQNVPGWESSYTISPITVNVVNQAAAIRTILVSNNSSESIAVGITTGGANAYTSPNTTALVPNAVSSQTPTLGGGSMCGSSNSFAACPTGSTCRPGGLDPNSQTPFFCYYDTPAITSYALNPLASATITISGSSGLNDPSGIIWSGNFFSRTGCDSVTGVCQNGTCGSNGLACNPGTGGAPGIMTLSEATFQQESIGPDYYDVSIINGLNFANAFGPTDASADNSDAYLCGTAGSYTAQGGGWPGSSGGLPAAAWNVTPNTTNAYPFPVSSTAPTGESSSYFRWVSFVTPSPTACTADSTCTSSNSSYRCGFIIQTADNASQITDNTIPINSSTTTYTRYCGVPIAWITADSLYGFESNIPTSNNLPFNLTASFTLNPQLPLTPPQSSIAVGNLQLCNYNTYSAYGTIPAAPFGNINLACGGVNWESLGITRVSQSPTISNPNWVTNVQPTVTWLKQTCPTCYTFPYDDMSSTFTCRKASTYEITVQNPPQ